MLQPRFQWFRDSKGYFLEGDVVKRYHGPLVPVQLDTDVDPVYVQFAHAHYDPKMGDSAREHGPKLAGAELVPPSDDGAILRFVRKWGFLFSADADEEPLERIYEHRRRISAFVDFALGKSRKGAKHPAELFNELSAATMRLHLRRMGPGAYDMLVLPSSLASYMWFRIGQLLSGQCALRTCRNCETPIEIEADDGRRGKREFCSTRCRVAHFRKA